METLSIGFYDICLIIEQIVIKQEHVFLLRKVGLSELPFFLASWRRFNYLLRRILWIT